MKIKNLTIRAFLVFLSQTIISCGGGGSNGSNETNSPENPEPSLPREVSFTSPTSYLVSGEPRNIQMLDANRDGFLDVVVMTGANKTVSLLLNDGAGNLSQPETFPALPSLGTSDLYGTDGSGSSLYVVKGDFNGDGITDLAVPYSIVNNFTVSNWISVLLGTTDGGFSAPTAYSTEVLPRRAASGDLNGDGISDVIVVSKFGDVETFLGQANGSLISIGINSDAANALDIAEAVIADFDGDQIPDISILATVPEKLLLLQGQGDGTFVAHDPVLNVLTNLGTEFVNLTDCNVNGDQYPDFLVTDNGSVDAVIGKEDGTFIVFGAALARGKLESFDCADMNSDGINDAIGASRSTSAIEFMPGNGTLPEFISWPESGYQHFSIGNIPSYLTIADLNSDGQLDIITASPDGSIRDPLGNVTTNPNGGLLTILLNTTELTQ